MTPARAAVRGTGGDDGNGGRSRLVLVRHGATAWSEAGRHTGRTDIPLLEEGRHQAEALGRLLAGHEFALVLTSPLERARKTCALAGFSAAAKPCDDLLEWDYGDYEGLTTEQIRRESPRWSLWDDGAPGGEQPEEVGRRAERVVSLARAESGDILAFGHGHLLRVVAARWLGLAPREGRLLRLDPATVSILGWERDTAVVSRWNDTAGDPLA